VNALNAFYLLVNSLDETDKVIIGVARCRESLQKGTEPTGCAARVTGAWGLGHLGSDVRTTSHWASCPRRVFLSRYHYIRVNNTVIAPSYDVVSMYQLVSVIRITLTYFVFRTEFIASKIPSHSPLHSPVG
jgi:hypothetical protein